LSRDSLRSAARNSRRREQQAEHDQNLPAQIQAECSPAGPSECDNSSCHLIRRLSTSQHKLACLGGIYLCPTVAICSAEEQVNLAHVYQALPQPCREYSHPTQKHSNTFQTARNQYYHRTANVPRISVLPARIFQDHAVPAITQKAPSQRNTHSDMSTPEANTSAAMTVPCGHGAWEYASIISAEVAWKRRAPPVVPAAVDERSKSKGQ
jgi:hypothetical protein